MLRKIRKLLILTTLKFIYKTIRYKLWFYNNRVKLYLDQV